MIVRNLKYGIFEKEDELPGVARRRSRYIIEKDSERVAPEKALWIAVIQGFIDELHAAKESSNNSRMWVIESMTEELVEVAEYIHSDVADYLRDLFLKCERFKRLSEIREVKAQERARVEYELDKEKAREERKAKRKKEKELREQTEADRLRIAEERKKRDAELYEKQKAFFEQAGINASANKPIVSKEFERLVHARNVAQEAFRDGMKLPPPARERLHRDLRVLVSKIDWELKIAMGATE